MARRAPSARIPRREVLALGAGLTLPALARAQSGRFPDRPIRLVVPFGAGGNLDTLARLLTPGMAERLGQPVVIENRAGAGGNLGTELVARAQPDGYSLLLGSNGGLTINPLIMERVPYDPARDLLPVALCFRTPNVLVASRKLPVATLAEFIAYAKAKPGQVQCGSAGSGTSNHLMIELLNAATGIGLVHVPYRASGAATPDLLSGVLPASMEQITIALPLHRDGQLRIIGIGLPERSPLLPEVPTFAEVGVPDGGLVSFIGILVPTGTPERVIGQLRDAIAGALADPALRARVEETGSLVAGAEAATPAGFGALLRREADLSRRAAAAAGMLVR
ncbi:tripartite tricarboxylate transporter substrate binding protein [Belnapia sp. T6]|uniref:Tripartite tricarboxylate transporter substrate binding protein n=1 Tax=Belnapia mucosa TaxID=2804532 RepID=A0ABS1UZ20_9PROT|nr:tripartite tricarboxylate transporter substrate binding protein [Belnapia mucosa]MBL6454640.1 tripartite tricarboxylate transporter substrate binding protein [Belnapia mucosa]